MELYELMLGNYFINLESGEMERVTDIRFDWDEKMGFVNGVSLDYVEPISLTDKWMNDLDTDSIKIEEDEAGYYQIIDGNHIEFEFVHQLQNYHFVIVGEELEL